jgi:hypothetical protein
MLLALFGRQLASFSASMLRLMIGLLNNSWVWHSHGVVGEPLFIPRPSPNARTRLEEDDGWVYVQVGFVALVEHQNKSSKQIMSFGFINHDCLNEYIGVHSRDAYN